MIPGEEEKRNDLGTVAALPFTFHSVTRFFIREDVSSPQHTNMPAFLRTVATRAAPVLRGHTVSQRASVFTKPAKEKIGPVVSPTRYHTNAN